MRDPFSWSFPIGRLFGITIRIHFLFPLVALGLILRAAFDDKIVEGTWHDVAMLLGLLFFSVLLHELGHCFAARWMNGDAEDVLLWPLGGLAAVDVPHTPKANFVTAAGGPAVNLALCIVSAAALTLCFEPSWRPPWDIYPLWSPFRASANGQVYLQPWSGPIALTANLGAIILARLFYVNFFLFLLNVCLIGFPLDGGRMFQCALWPYFGYRQATLYAIYAGWVVMFIVIVAAFAFNEVLALGLAALIYFACYQQRMILETGGDESLFGYDFSQGYTSLEREEERIPAPPRKKKANFLRRWLERRSQRKREKELERQEAEERRMDQLLEKIAREGKNALTDEEHRFLKRVADRYRNRP